MRVLFDTNVILDLFLDRAPFADDAAALWTAVTDGRIDGFVSAITPVNLFYIARRLRDRQSAFDSVKELLAVMSVSPVDHTVLQNALTLSFTDYEDAVQHASATSNGIATIVTRNVKDFSGSTVSIVTPSELLSQLPTSPNG